MLVTTGFITIPEFYRVIKVLRQSKQSINEMESRQFSDEIAKLSAAPGNSSAPKLKWISPLKITAEFNGNYLKRKKAASNLKNLINLSIAYKLDVLSRDLYRKQMIASLEPSS